SLSAIYSGDRILPDRIGQIEHRPLRIVGGDCGADQGPVANAASADCAVAAFEAIESAYRFRQDSVRSQSGVENLGAAGARGPEAAPERGHLVVRGGGIECASDRGGISGAGAGAATSYGCDGLGHRVVGAYGQATAAEGP